jgi:hypothetical protein
MADDQVQRLAHLLMGKAQSINGGMPDVAPDQAMPPPHALPPPVGYGANYPEVLDQYVTAYNAYKARGMNDSAEMMRRELMAHGNAAVPFLAKIAQ